MSGEQQHGFIQVTSGLDESQITECWEKVLSNLPFHCDIKRVMHIYDKYISNNVGYDEHGPRKTYPDSQYHEAQTQKYDCMTAEQQDIDVQEELERFDLKYYSSFKAYTGRFSPCVGLNVSGLTILKADTLRAIAKGHLPRGKGIMSRIMIRKFRRFCTEAYEKGYWVIHCGL